MLARFISADTIIPGQSSKAGAADPQELNRYSYGLNNPVKNTDPTGHCSAGLSWGMVNGQCYQEALHQYMDPNSSTTDRAIGFIYAQADIALVSVAAVATAGVADIIAAGGVATAAETTTTAVTTVAANGEAANESEATSTVSAFVSNIAQQVNNQVGGVLESVKTGDGYKNTLEGVAQGGRDIVARIMERGGGREEPYARVSIEGLTSFTENGAPTTARGLSHIDLKSLENPVETIVHMINSAINYRR